jgi:hypothetical protein
VELFKGERERESEKKRGGEGSKRGVSESKAENGLRK